MLDIKDFAIFETDNTFDFKGFLAKVGGYWKLFLLSLLISFAIAYQVNIRKEKVYSLDTVISVKEETNPLFTSNTSLVFNWGGTSDQVQSISTTLRSRSHNEIVVDKLQYYINYLVKGKYNLVDVYGEVPFYVAIDKSKSQLTGTPIVIKFLNNTEYLLTILFPNDTASLINYENNIYETVPVLAPKVIRKCRVGDHVQLPYLSWKLQVQSGAHVVFGKEYLVQFNDFDSTVSNYRAISVKTDDIGGSIITLGLSGTNKARIADYLNNTVKILINRHLEEKNQFATNTIRFIDSTLVEMENQLKETTNELKSFRKGKKSNDIEVEAERLSENLLEFEVRKDEISRKLSYFNSLKSYLQSNIDYSKLPAPTVAGIDDPNIVANVSKLITLSIKRSEMSYVIKGEKLFQDFDHQMNAVKYVLLENIANAKLALNDDMALIKNKIDNTEKAVSSLPDDQQELLKIKRKYDLSDNIYNTFLQKRSEADIVKAANLSDIHFIDPAKDIGGGLLADKSTVNYILAFFLGVLIPLVIVLLIFFINNTIQNTDDIARLTKIPLIGVVGLGKDKVDLAVFSRPKSALAESFRAIRSSLQFLYKQQNVGHGKTLMITSSVSGEGKTFCSLNIATVFALSEKKTVIVGFDLRKPKLFNEFNLSNEVGVVNYLIQQSTVDDITNTTTIPYLDVILSGPVPPNPSEMILSDRMKLLFKELKDKYDYIILDTPPVGLVSDALELDQYCDVTLYIVRQNYTKKDMIMLLNNRVKRGELKNTSIIMNCYQNKAKYGADNGYGYGYGSSVYSNGYNESEELDNIFKRAKNFLKGS